MTTKTRLLRLRITLLLLIGAAILPLALQPAQAAVIPYYAKTNTIAVPGTNIWFMDFAPTNRLYAPDNILGKILVYDQNFNIVQNITGFQNPRGVAVNGEYIYVSDDGTSNLTVLHNGVFLNSTSVTSPRDITIDTQGNILVSAFSLSEVHVFSPNLTLIATLSVANPEGVAVDPEGRIHVSSLTDRNVSIFTPWYSFIQTYGNFGGNNYGLDINVDGYIFVADGGQVEIFSPDLEGAGVLPGFSFPLGIVTDDVGRVFIYDATAKTITTWDTNDIGDFEGPSISNIQLTPLNPAATQPITITTTITDLSGIHNATLTYLYSGGNATVIMTGVGDTYTAVLPALPSGSLVNFSIYAEDTTYQHWDTTSPTYQFNVLAGASPLPVDTYLLAIAGLGLGGVALVLALVSLTRGGKKKRK